MRVNTEAELSKCDVWTHHKEGFLMTDRKYPDVHGDQLLYMTAGEHGAIAEPASRPIDWFEADCVVHRGHLVNPS